VRAPNQSSPDGTSAPIAKPIPENINFPPNWNPKDSIAGSGGSAQDGVSASDAPIDEGKNLQAVKQDEDDEDELDARIASRLMSRQDDSNSSNASDGQSRQ